ncbi:MAG: 3-isopropylmalate dehydrogenase, partial [Firmicutes bacterium]|nr:3-isopropylmalate dehydrogenase [Bacillota bacterium]
MFRIAVLPGDGIGPEIVPEAVKVLQACAGIFDLAFAFSEAPVGGAAIELTGHPLPEETLALCRESDAIILGAIGGPRWDHLPLERRPEAAALLPLRKELGLFANLRPVNLYPALLDASPL